jgi:hypothetical protein
LWRFLQHNNIKCFEVHNEEQLKDVIENKDISFFTLSGIDDPTTFEENMNNKKLNNLVETFLKEQNNFLIEGHEVQILKDMFAKLISYTGFPTIVNSRNFIKAIMYLLDKWSSFLDNETLT